MKIKEQVDKLRSILDGDERERRKRKDELKHLLKKMKSKEKHLLRKIESQSDAKKSDRLKQETAMLHKQRKKGLESLKSLNEQG